MTYTEFSTDLLRRHKDYCRLQSNNKMLRKQISFLKSELYTLQNQRKKPLRKTDMQKHIEKAVLAVNTELPCELWMLTTNSKKREIVVPRQIVMYLLRDESAFSHSLIGLNCGGRDHSTVISACRIIDNIIETEQIMGGKIKKIINNYKKAI